jgi:hypothetical protein
MRVKLSVIMSVYKNDSLENLILSVESILMQTLNNFHFYIQTDGIIPKQLDSYLDSLADDRVIILKRDKNIGLAASLNDLLEHILPLDYKYIARMDADDISDINRFKEQVAFLELNKLVDLVGTNANLINEKSNIIGVKKVKQKVSFTDMIKKCELIHPSIMFRNTFFEKFGLYDVSLKKSQDFDLWLRALLKGANIENLQKNLINFRYEEEIINRRKNEQKQNMLIKKKYLSGYKYYLSIVPNFIIMILPNFILKIIIQLKIK